MYVVYILCIACLSTLFANVVPSSNSRPPFSVQQSPDLHSSQYPLPQKQKDNLIAIRRSPRRLTKRTDNDDDDLRIRYVQILTSTVPILSAARELDRLYNNILYNALVLWASIPLSQRLTFRMGCLELTMHVGFSRGTPRSIPWAFVRNFCRNMLAATRTGFVGTYRMSFASIFGEWNPELRIEVELRIRWEELPYHIPP